MKVMNHYKALAEILRKAQGHTSTETEMPIDVGYEVRALRREIDQLQDAVGFLKVSLRRIARRGEYERITKEDLVREAQAALSVAAQYGEQTCVE